MLDQVQNLIISRISQFNRLSGQALEQRLLPLGITVQEFRIVGLLMGDESTTQKQLAEKLSVRPATLSVALSKLEQRGVLERVPSSSDGRVNYLRINKKNNMAQVGEMLGQLEQQVCHGVSEKELQITRSVLSRLIDNITVLQQKRSL